MLNIAQLSLSWQEAHFKETVMAKIRSGYQPVLRSLQTAAIGLCTIHDKFPNEEDAKKGLEFLREFRASTKSDQRRGWWLVKMNVLIDTKNGERAAYEPPLPPCPHLDDLFDAVLKFEALPSTQRQIDDLSEKAQRLFALLDFIEDHFDAELQQAQQDHMDAICAVEAHAPVVKAKAA